MRRMSLGIQPSDRLDFGNTSTPYKWCTCTSTYILMVKVVKISIAAVKYLVETDIFFGFLVYFVFLFYLCSRRNAVIDFLCGLFRVASSIYKIRYCVFSISIEVIENFFCISFLRKNSETDAFLNSPINESRFSILKYFFTTKFQFYEKDLCYRLSFCGHGFRFRPERDCS